MKKTIALYLLPKSLDRTNQRVTAVACARPAPVWLPAQL
jgi:hypothetical protein